MANTHLTRSITSTNSSWTFSAWVKRSYYGTTSYLCSWGSNGSSGNGIGFSSADKLQYYSEATGSNPVSSAIFRDLNAWYHVCVKNDAGTITLYMNGETLTNTGGTAGSALNSSTLRIGDWVSGQYHHDGCMSHVHFIDGTAYSASAFGQIDNVTGEWNINTAPSVTYGTDGCFILKDGNSLTDQSGNSNNYTANGTLTKTEDNPSNNFCVYNKLQQTNGSAGFENGCTYFTNGTQWLGVNGTIAATSGKYYAEFKVTGTTGWGVGVADVDSLANDTKNLSTSNTGYQCKYTGGKQIFLNGSTIVAMENNSTVVNNAGMGNTSFANNDIVMVALDLDNNNLFFGKNGTWLRGATESEIEAGTSTNATFSGSDFDNKFWTWSVCTELENMRMNAGNGYFSTTAVSSAGTNASGIGIFEYNVPAGFTALSTKGINSF